MPKLPKLPKLPKSAVVEVTVDAAPVAVWTVLSDVTRIGEWSHECRSARWLGGATSAIPGARFQGRNRSGRIRWPRTNEVIQADPPRELSWRTLSSLVFPDSTRWRVRLEPVGSGTRIVQDYQIVKIPAVLDRFFAFLIKGHRDRNEALRDDLRRLGALAVMPTTAPPASGRPAGPGDASARPADRTG